MTEQQPPHYPPPGHQQPPPPGYYPPRPGPYDISASIGWGWRKFFEHKTVFIVGMLPALLVTIAFYVAYIAVNFPLMFGRDTYTDDEALDVFVRLGVVFGVFLLLQVPVAVLQANMIRVALLVADGGRPTIGMLYSTRRLGRVLVTLFMLGAGTLLGLLLCFLPGLAFAVFASYTLHFVLDQDMRPVEAVKASFSLVRGNLGLSIGTILLIGLVASAGTYALVVGMVVSVPVALLAQVYCYRALILGTVRP